MGELLLILAQVAFAVEFLFLKKLLQNGYNPLLVSVITNLIGIAVLLPLVFYFDNVSKVFTSPKISWFVIAGVVGVAIANTLEIYGLGKITISNASLLTLTFPLFAILLGIIFLGEPITFKFIAASFFMAIGYLLLVI